MRRLGNRPDAGRSHAIPAAISTQYPPRAEGVCPTDDRVDQAGGRSGDCLGDVPMTRRVDLRAARIAGERTEGHRFACQPQNLRRAIRIAIDRRRGVWGCVALDTTSWFALSTISRADGW